MAQHLEDLFQTTTHVNERNLDTFADSTKPPRNPRCGQWVKLAWLNKRSRFIGVSPGGVQWFHHGPHGPKNNDLFSEKVRAFRRFTLDK